MGVRRCDRSAVPSVQLVQTKYVQSSNGENGFDLDDESGVPYHLTSLAENAHGSCQKRRFTELRKGTVSFVMSVCQHETTPLLLHG